MSVTLPSISPICASVGAPAGIPMSTTVTSPAWALPGAIQSPGLPAWKVAVAAAVTATPATSPVELSTPLGTSQAKIIASPATALIASIALLAGSRGSPSNPVPRIASTIAAAPSSAAGSNGRTGGPVRRSRLVRASPRKSSGAPSSSTSTSRPRLRNRRATTSPSPPLLPLPHTTATRPSGTRRVDELRETGPGALHQLDSRDPALVDRPTVGRALLLGVGQRRQPAGEAHGLPPYRRGALGHRDRARVPAGVGERHAHDDPQAGGATSGGAVEPHPGSPAGGHDLDLTPAQGFQAERLGDRLLGAEPGGEVLAGPRPGRRVLALSEREQPLGQRRPARECALEPFDLEQIDADRRVLGRCCDVAIGGHSTVTVLARFRG